MGQSRKITDGALLIAVYVVLLLLVMFIPFVILFGVFILPIPFVFYAARHDWQPALMMLIATIVVSSIFATVISLPLTLLAGIGGVVIGTAIKHDVSAYDTWARGSIGFIVGLVLNILFIQLVLDVNLNEEIDLMIQDSMNFAKVLLDQTGLIGESEEQLKLIEEQMSMFVDLLPSSLAVMGIVMAFLSQWLSYKMISRIDNKTLSFPPFRKLNLPTSIVWFYLIILVMSLFDLTNNSTLYLIVINAMVVLTVLLIIQGFSFIFFYTNHKNIHQSIPIILVISSFILPFILLFFVRLIGIIDIGFSLKEKIAQGKANK